MEQDILEVTNYVVLKDDLPERQKKKKWSLTMYINFGP